MSKIKRNSLKYDVLILFGIFIILYFILIKIDFNLSIQINSFVGILIGLFGTLLGFILTAFTIIFMFDTDKNPTLNKIKKAGLYNQIHERFITTIIITFISLIYVLIYYFSSFFISTYFILNFILIYLLSLTILRIYRSLNILYLIYKTL